ncbi:hypothetical protein [Corynebacterium sp. p3-SID1194]|uniref:hypothetical protein n=1 Tax=Corynebacterium sp. p3-SID1194 TaxID=2916105 RepID=UPI0021A6DF85|nr:hypothetical protein [Corynebacterium sp. p3-SID1194]MCT1450617.1 hypothetical protein [Corynebacterium sp. p3-SID1194]
MTNGNRNELADLHHTLTTPLTKILLCMSLVDDLQEAKRDIDQKSAAAGAYAAMQVIGQRLEDILAPDGEDEPDSFDDPEESDADSIIALLLKTLL